MSLVICKEHLDCTWHYVSETHGTLVGPQESYRMVVVGGVAIRKTKQEIRG